MNERNKCVESFRRNELVAVHGDLNASVWNTVIKGISRQYGVPGKNGSGEQLMDVCQAGVSGW